VSEHTHEEGCYCGHGQYHHQGGDWPHGPVNGRCVERGCDCSSFERKRPDVGVWDAGDGTRWTHAPGLRIWTGWVPGEDGVWTRTDEEFRLMYPEAPVDSGSSVSQETES